MNAFRLPFLPLPGLLASLLAVAALAQAPVSAVGEPAAPGVSAAPAAPADPDVPGAAAPASPAADSGAPEASAASRNPGDTLSPGPADTAAAPAADARAEAPAEAPADSLRPAPGDIADAPAAGADTALHLPEAVVKGRRGAPIGLGRLRSVDGAGIYDGKKTEVIDAAAVAANTAANNARQIFAKVPGVNVWESDGGGLQMGVGARGLSPKRTSEFNTRVNGYDLSADALGYPESYYTPPMEGLDRIEVVRGAASLQYGSQFGGMINFAMKKGPKDTPFQLVSRQTGGSNAFWNSFNSLAGQLGPGNYYGFYQHKQGDDFRPNSAYDMDVVYLSQALALSPTATLSADLTVMRYLAQQPGGLTDAEFRRDPYQSTRERNWFAVDWNLAAARLEVHPIEGALWDTRVFGLAAGRDALGAKNRLGALQSPDRPDPGEERDLLMDDYRNVGLESRWLQRFPLLGRPAAVLVGGRAYRGRLDRRQGSASDGSGPDFRYLNPDSLEGSDFRFPSLNLAGFVEAVIPVSDVVNLTPGFRLEHIATEARGTYNADVRHPNTGELLLQRREDEFRERERTFPLLGLGASAFLGAELEVYANVSQNFRGINFNDMWVRNGNEVDPDLTDETGFNADLGARGNVRGILDYDVSLFWLAYEGRIGVMTDPDDGVGTYRTNISDSRNLGIEAFGEVDPWRIWRGEGAKAGLPVFLNTTLLEARYVDSHISAVRDKRVELVPWLLLRGGVQWKYGPVRLAWQTAYTGRQYTEATNAELMANAINGAVPAYTVSDASAKATWKGLVLEAGCDNVFDREYFTRRADAYPGPGIIPSPGRNLYVTLGAGL